MPKGSGGGGRPGRSGGGGETYTTESGKPASSIPVQLSVGGDTYLHKEELKAAGYKYESDGFSKVWRKEVKLSDAPKEAQKLKESKIIRGDRKVGLSTSPKNKEDDRDVYFFNKKYM
jgi:hypothetical protein